MGPINLAKIKAAHLKLMRLDPDYADRFELNRHQRNRNAKRNAAAKLLRQFKRDYEHLVRCNEPDHPLETDVECIVAQDGMLLDLSASITGSSQVRATLQATRPKLKEIRAERFTVNGESKTVREWSIATGIPTYTLYWRIKAGWKPDDVIRMTMDTTRGARSAKLYSFNGQSKTLEDWATATGLHHACLYHRIKAGWPLAKALTTLPGAIMGRRSHRGRSQTFQNAQGTAAPGSRDIAPKQGFSS